MRASFAVAVAIPVLAQCQETYDYIVAGAGTAGLVVANRLSADPSITVAVVEPGGDERTNPNVTSVLGYLTAFNTSIDWQYSIVPQSGLQGRDMQYHAGKAIGGTSTINGMTFLRGDAAEIDAWESLGNTGWNWDALWPYYTGVENFTIPTEAQVESGASYNPDFHGEEGRLKTGYAFELLNGTFYETVQETWGVLGLQRVEDPNGGDMRGFSVWPQTLDRDADMREDAARAFWQPIEERPNLKIVRGTVRRIVWKKEEDGCDELAAEGVEYITDQGETAVLGANKDVILSAGALRSPLILELSGVGNPSVLESLGIETKIDLPGVGENMIEQPLALVGYMADYGNTTGAVAPFGTFINAQDTFGNETASTAASTKASLADWAAQVSAANNGSINATALEAIYEVQHGLIFNKNVTTGEILTTPVSGYLVNVFWPLLPFSRGSVHLRSTDAIDDPAIDPKYLLAEFDLTMLTGLGRVAQSFFYQEPISDLVTGYVIPGDNVLPPNATNAQWKDLLEVQVTPNHHALATAAMMSRDLGGVVDPQLKVYGTSNVRVIDASVIPLQISGHLTATIYAVADRASDIILGKL
ncbi:GMC oxidoreductase [Xylariales sp. AK1849]|nr:GMC oxidoreductase [Xylariales sp. AK1849]